jgi:hypothetical protein
MTWSDRVAGMVWVLATFSSIPIYLRASAWNQRRRYRARCYRARVRAQRGRRVRSGHACRRGSLA